MRVKLNNEQGIVFIAMVVGMMVLSIFGLTIAALVSNQMTSSIQKLQSAQAFYIADGGLQYILMDELDGDPDLSDNVSPTDPPFGPTSITMGRGEFWVEYSNQEVSSIDIKVTARVRDSIREVEGRISRNEFDVNAATMVDGNISIANTTGEIYGAVLANGTNMSIDDAVVNLPAANDWIAEADIIVPDILLSVYDAMTTSTHIGNLTITSAMSPYTANIHVTGNLTIGDDVIVKGLFYAEGGIVVKGGGTTGSIINGTLVSEGNINIQNGNIVHITAQAIDADHHMPAIVSTGTLSISATETIITGLVWTGSVGTTSNCETFTLTGALICQQNANIANVEDLSIIYDPTVLGGIPGLVGNTSVDSLKMANWRTY